MDLLLWRLYNSRKYRHYFFAILNASHAPDDFAGVRRNSESPNRFSCPFLSMHATASLVSRPLLACITYLCSANRALIRANGNSVIPLSHRVTAWPSGSRQRLHLGDKIGLIPQYRQPLLGLDLEAAAPVGQVAHPDDVIMARPRRGWRALPAGRSPPEEPGRHVQLRP
jgi:hypothetical protein